MNTQKKLGICKWENFCEVRDFLENNLKSFSKKKIKKILFCFKRLNLKDMKKNLEEHFAIIR
jgi:hypothetical protein